MKKHKHHSYAVKIRKHHPYEQWLKVRRKMDEADLRKKTETNVIADFLSRVMPTGQVSKVTPPPPPPPPHKMRRGTQTDVTSASVTASHLRPPMKEFTYEPSNEERVEGIMMMMSTMTMIISSRMKLGSTLGKMSVL